MPQTSNGGSYKLSPPYFLHPIINKIEDRKKEGKNQWFECQWSFREDQSFQVLFLTPLGKHWLNELIQGDKY